PAAVLDFARPIGGDRRLPVLPEPVPVQPGVQVVPRQYLAVVTLSRSVPSKVHWPVRQRRLAGARPAGEREVLAPPVEARPAARPDSMTRRASAAMASTSSSASVGSPHMKYSLTCRQPEE